MAFFGKRKEKKKFTQQNPLFKRRKFCRFSAAGVDEIDYKDLDTLRDFIRGPNMQVILLEKVVNVGNLGEVVRVRDGYARNFLIPQKKARRATDAALKEFEARRAELEKVQAEKLAAAQALGERLEGFALTISQKAGVDGRLFGSVTNMDIATGLVAAGFAGIEKAQVRLPEGPLKTIGETAIQVALHPDVVSTIKVVVVGEVA